MHVPAGAKILMLSTGMDAAAISAFESNYILIKRLARIKQLDHVTSFPKGCATVASAGASFGLPLAGIIDIEQEKARLQKSIDKLAKELGGLRGRVNNPKFVESAPQMVVDETRANLALREAEESQLRTAMARLSELG